MAHLGLWQIGLNVDIGDTVFDDDGNLFFAVRAEESTEANRPVPGTFRVGGTGTTPTGSVDEDEVREIVAAMFGTDSGSRTGIRLEYDEDEGEYTLTATRTVSFTDISNAIQAHLEGQPAGQYWLVVQREATA